MVAPRRWSCYLANMKLAEIEQEALALSDAVYLLSAGPRARIAAHHIVDLPRPRDLSAVHADPRFGPMVARLWTDLSLAAA